MRSARYAAFLASGAGLSPGKGAGEGTGEGTGEAGAGEDAGEGAREGAGGAIFSVFCSSLRAGHSRFPVSDLFSRPRLGCLAPLLHGLLSLKDS